MQFSEREILVHHLEPSSRANGPGLRAVLWVQGCALGCPGCFNPESHTFDQGEVWQVEALFDRLLQTAPTIEGLTISGGEPVHQHRALARLLTLVRANTSLSTLIFSGYRMEEIRRLPGTEKFLSLIDVMIAGRYDATNRVANGLIGSANKEIHFLTNRYSPADLQRVPHGEVIISPDGEIILSGIDPLQW